jgi:hypothetical protein
MFLKRRKPTLNTDAIHSATAPKYDDTKLIPAIRSSICTGEQVAGFRNRETRAFTEIMLIKSEKDLASFKAKYGIEGEIEVFY